MQDIYSTWRTVLDDDDPPRMAVAEASVNHLRRPRHATRYGLPQG